MKVIWVLVMWWFLVIKVIWVLVKWWFLVRGVVTSDVVVSGKGCGQ